MKTKIIRPLQLYVIIVAYILAPVMNILLFSLLNNQIPLGTVLSNFFSAYGPFAAIWLFTAPLVGISFWFVKPFTWYAFLIHSSWIVLDSIIKLVFSPANYFNVVSGPYLLLMMLGNVVLVIIIGFVLQKDFKTPYFQVLPRSWRANKRFPIKHSIAFNKKNHEISDLSYTGCFVPGTSTGFHVGDNLDIQLQVAKKTITCSGTVVREAGHGLGIQFHKLSTSDKGTIKNFVKDYLANAKNK